MEHDPGGFKVKPAGSLPMTKRRCEKIRQL
jgi:hypothetical protein